MALFAQTFAYTRVSGDTVIEVDIDDDGVYIFAINGSNLVMRTYPLMGGAHTATITTSADTSPYGAIRSACRVGTGFVAIDNRNVRVYDSQGVQTSRTDIRNDALTDHSSVQLRGIDYDVSTNPDTYILLFSAVDFSQIDAPDEVWLGRLAVSLPSNFSSQAQITSGTFDEDGQSLGKSTGGIYVSDPDADDLRMYSNSFAFVEMQAISQVGTFRGVGFHESHLLVVDDDDFHYYGEAPSLPDTGLGYTPPVALPRQIEGLEEFYEFFDVVRESDPLQVIAVDADMMRQTAATLIAFLGVDTPGVTKQLSRLLITPVYPIREVELGDRIFLHEGIRGLVPSAVPSTAWVIVGFLSVSDSIRQTFVCESP